MKCENFFSLFRFSTVVTPCKMNKSDVKNRMIKIFKESVKAVDPVRLVRENLTLSGNTLKVCGKTYELNDGNIYLVGFGKAVLGMAAEAERILGPRLMRGVISVPVGARTDAVGKGPQWNFKHNSVVEVLEGAKNNLPDEAAERAADKIMKLISSISNESDKLIVLISGGGSALLPKPKPGITLEEKLRTITYLTSSGANINELNVVRKKLSQVKGGGLASLSYPIQTIGLILSDVLNDPLDVIASGPTVPNLHPDSAAYDILKKYNLMSDIPKSVLQIIEKSNTNNTLPVVSKSFPHAENYLIGNNKKAINAAKHHADVCGFYSVIFSHEVNGLVENISDFYKDLLVILIDYFEKKNEKECLFHIEELIRKYSFACEMTHLQELLIQMAGEDVGNFCIIAGGETTVKLKGCGVGGRNQELALIFLVKILELRCKYNNFFEKYDVMFLSAGTDGIDGPTDVAGALVDSTIADELIELKININDYLQKNDSYNFYMAINNGSNLIRTGHTGTNVADIHILVIWRK